MLLAALGAAGAACAPSSFVAVDPYPCADGGNAACGPGLLDGLVGYWRLNDAAGSATARDWSSWGNDGKLVDLDPSAAWVMAGPDGTALSVEGKGYVAVADSSSLDSITTQVTVAAWIYLEQTNTDFATAISRQIGTGLGQLYHLSINPMQLPALYITIPSRQLYLMAPSTAPIQTWVHLAGTWDGSTARLYVEGVQVASADIAGTLGAETNPVILGGNGNGDKVTELVTGRLNEVVLYRRALSAAEVARLASAPLLPSSTARADAGAR